MQAEKEAKSQDDAPLLANNMDGITRELGQQYRKYITRAMSKDALFSEIKNILKGNWDTTPIERVFEELELRYELRNHLSRILTDSDPVILNSNQLVLDKNHRIDIGETLRRFYLSQLKKDKPNINVWYCAKFGFDEFLDEHYSVLEKTFIHTEIKENHDLVWAFRCALRHGNLPFAQKIWTKPEALDLKQELISGSNFYCAAIAQTSTHSKIREYIKQCFAELGLTDKIPSFSDDDLFPFYALSNNKEGLLTCWKKPRSANASLELLTKDDCDTFDRVADEFFFEARVALIECLIDLSQTKTIDIPNDIWIRYFEISVLKAPLSSIMLLWDANKDDELRIKLIFTGIFKATSEFHVPIMKFLIEQTELYPANTIVTQDDLEFIKAMAHELAKLNCDQLKELLSHSPLTKNIQLHL